MSSDYKMPSSIKRKILRKAPTVSSSESSGRRFGDFSEYDIDSRAYKNILFYLQKGLSSYSELIKGILKPILQMQYEASIEYTIIPFTFGIDDDPFYKGRHFNINYQMSISNIAKVLLELSGNTKSQNPAIIPRLFPKSTPANSYSGGKTRIKKKEDLLIVIGKKDEVFFGELIREKVEKFRKQILFVEIENENVNWYFYDYQPKFMEIKQKRRKKLKRELDEYFMDDLLNGNLKEILNYVKKDHTLDLEIRNNYVNIYYRGGNILRIKKKGAKYEFHFDNKYITFDSSLKIINMNINTDWNSYFPQAKQVMDFYFSAHNNEEREYQQLVVRENNYSSISNGTDYFILDIEYDNHKGARFDIIAIEWPSEATKRKLFKGFKPKLVVIEMKYGDGALSGKSGMKKHFDDFAKLISNPVDISDLKDEMLNVFKQKRKMGLIPCLSDSNNSNSVAQFSEEIELLFLIANHDPESKKLIKKLSGQSLSNVSFIVSNFMGYGLYNHCIHETQIFKNNFVNQI